jgi:hypothetical protein
VSRTQSGSGRVLGVTDNETYKLHYAEKILLRHRNQLKKVKDLMLNHIYALGRLGAKMFLNELFERKDISEEEKKNMKKTFT